MRGQTVFIIRRIKDFTSRQHMRRVRSEFHDRFAIYAVKRFNIIYNYKWGERMQEWKYKYGENEIKVVSKWFGYEPLLDGQK
ncbi:MAG: hypothetical protein FWG14_10205 [Peptococcaceae bacterium]|nr:hypothetical protein [Peptococcaceae bacterium]